MGTVVLFVDWRQGIDFTCILIGDGYSCRESCKCESLKVKVRIKSYLIKFSLVTCFFTAPVRLHS